MACLEGSPWTISEHCERYCQQLKTQQKLLRTAWDDLDVVSEEQVNRLEEVALKAENVWREALQHAENQRASVREQIDDATSRTRQVRSELSDETFPDVQDCAHASSTLKGQLDAAQAELNKWLSRRAGRQGKYEQLKGQVEQLRIQMGIRGSSVPVKSVTLYVLEGLTMELQRLQADQVERQKRLNTLMPELRKHCVDLGEDEGAIAAEVHPSLGGARDAQFSGQDLSDQTFDALREKIIELQDIEASRREKGRLKLATLTSLWDATDVPADDYDRQYFGALLSGPHSLYQSTLEKCDQEIARLEGQRVDLMKGIISHKRQQIAHICAESHMSVPHLPEADANEPGEVSESLARVLKHYQLTQQEAENRQEILSLIHGMEKAWEESEWLAVYEADPMKYKGRDSTRKIQRAVAAGKLRKQLPQLMDEVAAALEEYRDCSGRVFMYDNKHYQADILPEFRAKVQLDEEHRTQDSKTRTPGGPKTQAKTAVSTTPRRASRLGGRTSGSGDGSRKPAMPTTPRAEHRNPNLLRSVSSLSRTSSFASRFEMEAGGMPDPKAAKGVPGSPSISRTSSGIPDADRGTSVRKSIVIRQPSKARRDIATVLEEMSLMEASKENNSTNLMPPPPIRTLATVSRHTRSESM